MSPVFAVTFKTPPLAQRLHAFVENLKRPRIFALFLVAALLPAALDRTVALLTPCDWSLFLTSLALGFGSTLALLVLSAAIAVLLPVRACTITFSDEGIRVLRLSPSRREENHPWSYVAGVTHTDSHVLLFTEAEMRSFRLSSGTPRGTLLIPRDLPGFATFADLLVHNTRFRV